MRAQSDLLNIYLCLMCVQSSLPWDTPPIDGLSKSSSKMLLSPLLPPFSGTTESRFEKNKHKIVSGCFHSCQMNLCRWFVFHRIRPIPPTGSRRTPISTSWIQNDIQSRLRHRRASSMSHLVALCHHSRALKYSFVKFLSLQHYHSQMI